MMKNRQSKRSSGSGNIVYNNGDNDHKGVRVSTCGAYNSGDICSRTFCTLNDTNIEMIPYEVVPLDIGCKCNALPEKWTSFYFL